MSCSAKLSCLLLLAAPLAAAISDVPSFTKRPTGEPAPIGKNVYVYHIGNSLVRGLSVGNGTWKNSPKVDRVDPLFESAGANYRYFAQLAAGGRLPQHWGFGQNPPADTYTINRLKSKDGQDLGLWAEAWQKNQFDAIILQPFMTHLDKEPAKERDADFGDRQAIRRFIAYAMGDNPAKNKATDRFYLYQTWPTVKAVTAQGKKGNDATYEHYWTAPYDPAKVARDTVPSRDYFEKLIKIARQDSPTATIGIIPAGEVLCALDVKIRKGELRGLAAYLRRQGKVFDADKGVMQFYADNIHMNPIPHNGDKCGTIGAYAAALTIYATLSGENPVGMTAKPYEQINEKEDTDLIKTVQQTVWGIVSTHPHTGVKTLAK